MKTVAFSSLPITSQHLPRRPADSNLVQKLITNIMHKYIDFKTFLTIVLAGIALTLLKKYLVEIHHIGGKEKVLIGTPATGHV